MFDTTHNEATELFGGGFGNRRDLEREAAAIFESAGDPAVFGEQQLRSAAMAAALAWVEGGDFSYGALQDICQGIADLDESGDISEDEATFLADLVNATGDALASLGGDIDNVTTFINDEDDDAGSTLGAYLSDAMANQTDDDETLISDYATAAGDQVMEGLVKIVRAGKIAWKKKKIKGRHVKLNALQRAALKKARSKAFTGAAMRARKKSMHIRKKMGL